jgi:hypothetical protein
VTHLHGGVRWLSRQRSCWHSLSIFSSYVKRESEELAPLRNCSTSDSFHGGDHQSAASPVSRAALQASLSAYCCFKYLVARPVVHQAAVHAGQHTRGCSGCQYISRRFQAYLVQLLRSAVSVLLRRDVLRVPHAYTLLYTAIA